MKRRFIFATIICFCFSSCLTFKPIEFKRTENFSVTSNNNSPLLNFGIVFYNPNYFGCSIKELKSEGSLKDQQVFNAGMKSKTRIKGKTEFSIPVTARIGKMNVGQLLGAGLNLLLNDEAIPMKVKGEIKIKKCFFTKTYHFNYTQAIDKTQLKKLF